MKWTPDRPHTLVIACSDGRLQEQTDEFLHRKLFLTQFDRFYIPGGGGALASSGRDFIRAQRLRRECAYLIQLHEVSRVILMFHGPPRMGRPMLCVRIIGASSPGHRLRWSRTGSVSMHSSSSKSHANGRVTLMFRRICARSAEITEHRSGPCSFSGRHIFSEVERWPHKQRWRASPASCTL